MLASWELLILLSRVGLYAGVAGTLGALFALRAFRHPDDGRQRLLNYLRLSSLVGLVAIVGNFIARSAALSGSFQNTFDSIFLNILWQSGTGSSSRWQVAGFTALLLSSFALRRRQGRWLTRALVLGGILALLWSFTLNGHFATQTGFNKLVLVLHVLAMSLWLGAFYPLLILMKGPEGEANLRRFSTLGVGIVALLLSCGLWMALTLIGNFAHLLDTAYGWVLLSKLAFLSVLLILAAANKWILVPRYATGPTAIRRSIQGEILVAFFILLVTAILANLVSPH